MPAPSSLNHSQGVGATQAAPNGVASGQAPQGQQGQSTQPTPRFKQAGNQFPYRSLDVDNYLKALPLIKLGDTVIPAKSAMKPAKIEVYLNDGLPGNRKVTFRLFKAMSRFGIGSSIPKLVKDEKTGQMVPPAPNPDKPETFALQLQSRDNTQMPLTALGPDGKPQFVSLEQMGNDVFQTIATLMQAMSAKWHYSEKTASMDLTIENGTQIIRSAQDKITAATYGSSWRIGIYPDCKHLMRNWLPVAFEQLYDKAEKRGQSGLYTIDFEISHIWVLNKKSWGISFTITSSNFEPCVSDDQNTLLADAIANGWCPMPPALLEPELAYGHYQNGPEHDIITVASSGNPGKKRGREDENEQTQPGQTTAGHEPQTEPSSKRVAIEANVGDGHSLPTTSPKVIAVAAGLAGGAADGGSGAVPQVGDALDQVKPYTKHVEIAGEDAPMPQAEQESVE